MAVVFQRNEVSFESASTPVTVPNNDVARLMYYLNCVCTAIDCNHDPDIQRFTSYGNWHYLSTTEQAQLLVVCYTFTPDVFNNRVFFHSRELCGGSANKFYRINQVRRQIVAAESIVIAGQVREVNMIMTYKMKWMETYYLNPMKRLAAQLGSSSQTTTYRQTYTPTVVRQPVRSSSSSSCTAGRVCCILCCVLVIVPGLIGLIVGLTKN